MSDLIRNLRDLASVAHSDISVADEAADEIERLNAENARLRNMLSNIVVAWDWWQVDICDRCQSAVPSDAIDEARAALAEKEKADG